MDTPDNRGVPREPSDEEVIRLLQQRRPEGLRVLLERYGPKVAWYLRKEFGASLNEIEVDEVINLAAHKAWRSADRYEEGKGSLRAWFYTISRNCACTVLRRESKVHRHLEVTDWDRTSLEAVRSDDTPAAGPNAFVDDLRRCIGRLAPLQMSVIEADLRSGDVADAAELARELRTTKNTIYACRSAARKRLKRELMKLGHALSDATP